MIQLQAQLTSDYYLENLKPYGRRLAILNIQDNEDTPFVQCIPFRNLSANTFLGAGSAPDILCSAKQQTIPANWYRGYRFNIRWETNKCSYQNRL